MKFPATASQKTCLCYITLTITKFALPALLCADVKVVRLLVKLMLLRKKIIEEQKQAENLVFNQECIPSQTS